MQSRLDRSSRPKATAAWLAATAILVAAGMSSVFAQGLGERVGRPAGTGGPSTQPAVAAAPTTRPTPLPADELLNQMLKPNEAAARPLTPTPEADPRDVTSGRNATAPDAPSMPLLREGTFIVDRTGRLARSQDTNGFEFVFDSDGRTLRDPPMLILANSALQRMEDAVRSANRDLRFRVTGAVTEYRGRNSILIEKAVVIPDVVQQK